MITNDSSNTLNFEETIEKLLFLNSSTVLNFDIGLYAMAFIYILNFSTVLNFENISSEININNSCISLNFEVQAYDDTYAIYKILLDFIESMSYGDIF